MIGSLDHIEDSIESLRRDDCIYLLVIGRPGEKVTRCFCDLKGNVEPEIVEHVLSAGREMLEKEVRDAGDKWLS